MLPQAGRPVLKLARVPLLKIFDVEARGRVQRAATGAPARREPMCVRHPAPEVPAELDGGKIAVHARQPRRPSPPLYMSFRRVEFLVSMVVTSWKGVDVTSSPSTLTMSQPG